MGVWVDGWAGSRHLMVTGATANEYTGEEGGDRSGSSFCYSISIRPGVSRLFLFLRGFCLPIRRPVLHSLPWHGILHKMLKSNSVDNPPPGPRESTDLGVLTRGEGPVMPTGTPKQQQTPKKDQISIAACLGQQPCWSSRRFSLFC